MRVKKYKAPEVKKRFYLELDIEGELGQLWLESNGTVNLELIKNVLNNAGYVCTPRFSVKEWRKIA